MICLAKKSLVFKIIGAEISPAGGDIIANIQPAVTVAIPCKANGGGIVGFAVDNKRNGGAAADIFGGRHRVACGIFYNKALLIEIIGKAF